MKARWIVYTEKDGGPRYIRDQRVFLFRASCCFVFGSEAAGFWFMELIVGECFALLSGCRPCFCPCLFAFDDGFEMAIWQCFVIISTFTIAWCHGEKSCRVRQAVWLFTIFLPYLLCSSDGSFSKTNSSIPDDFNSFSYPPLFKEETDLVTVCENLNGILSSLFETFGSSIKDPSSINLVFRLISFDSAVLVEERKSSFVASTTHLISSFWSFWSWRSFVLNTMRRASVIQRWVSLVVFRLHILCAALWSFHVAASIQRITSAGELTARIEKKHKMNFYSKWPRLMDRQYWEMNEETHT